MESITLTYRSGATDFSRAFSILSVKGFLPGDGFVSHPNIQPNLLSGRRERYSTGFSRVFTLDFGSVTNIRDTSFLANFLTKTDSTKKTLQRLTFSYTYLLTGTISTSGTSVAGTSTLFTEELSVGSIIVAGGQTRTVATITDDDTLTVTVAFSPDLIAGTNLYISVTETNVGVLYQPELFESNWIDGLILRRSFSITLIEKDIRTSYPLTANFDEVTVAYFKNKVAITGTPASPQTLTTNAGALAVQENGDVFPTVDLDDYAVALDLTAGQEASVGFDYSHGTNGISNDGSNNLVVKVFHANIGNDADGAGNFYANVKFTVRSR